MVPIRNVSFHFGRGLQAAFFGESFSRIRWKRLSPRSQTRSQFSDGDRSFLRARFAESFWKRFYPLSDTDYTGKPEGPK